MDEAQGPEQDRPAAGDKKKVKALAKMLEIRVKQTHGRVSITSVPDGAFVRVTLEKSGEVVEGSTPLAEWLPFGAHQIEARKDGYLVFTRGLLVQPRMVPEVVIELKAEETGEAGAGAAGQPEAGQEAAVEAAATDRSLEALVLRIDSPGGSGFASDQIWRQLRRAAKRKPLVASMGNVAASGGYYLASAAPTILAEPATEFVRGLFEKPANQLQAFWEHMK